MTKFLATVAAFAVCWVICTVVMAVAFFLASGTWDLKTAGQVAVLPVAIGGTLGLLFNN